MQFSLSEIKLIVGLGNIGTKYTYTRHNAGFLFIDQLLKTTATQGSIIWKQDKSFKAELATYASKIVLCKPTTLMNGSGITVAALSNFYKLKTPEVLVVHDDLDMDLGSYKLQFNKGPKVHNGINSIVSKLGTDKFWRLRIGVDARPQKGNRDIAGQTYALQKFYPAELDTLYLTFQNIIINHFTHAEVN